MRIVLATVAAMFLAFVAAAQPPTAPPDKGGMPAKGDPPAAPPVAMVAPAGPMTFNGRTLEQWMKDIENPDPSVREQGIRATLMFGEPARKAIPALVRQVRIANDLSPLANSIIALGVLAPGSTQEYQSSAVDALTSTLNHTQAIIRYQSANSLGQIGLAARTAMPKLVERVNDRSSWEIRKAACFALGTAGRDDKFEPDMRALTALVDAVNDSSKEVRLEALQGIINLGPPKAGNIAQAKTLLERHLKNDKDKSVIIWVRVALMRLDEKEITDDKLALIAKQMKGNDLEINLQAARAIGFIGKAAKSKVPELIEALQSEEPLMVMQVCWSLGRMGSFAERSLASLQTLMSHKNDGVRVAAQSAITEITKKP